MSTYQKSRSWQARANALFGELVVGRLGWSIQGAHLLEVKGRKTGRTQTVPVNPVTVNGQRYLFAPRGETQWVRNLRAAGEATLRVGSKREPIVVREVADVDKPEIMRAYLDRWHWQISSLVEVEKDASLEQLAEIAHKHPVFQIDAKRSPGSNPGG